MAKREQHDQYKETPTSAMTTLDALNVVEQLNSALMVLADTTAVQPPCESCYANLG